MIHALAYYADRGRASDVRIRHAASLISARSSEFGITVESTDHIAADVANIDGVPVMKRVHVPYGINMVIFSRPHSWAMVQTILWLRHNRPEIGICVDVDEHEDLEVRRRTGAYENLKRSCALADVLICATQALADEFSYDLRRTFVVRSGVPASMLQQPARALTRRRSHEELNRDRIIGASSHSLAQFNRDAVGLSNALAEVVGKDVTDGRVVSYRHVETVGAPRMIPAAVNLPPHDVEVAVASSLPLYRVALSEIDVAVVPVTDDDVRSRDALRIIEFAAAGVPVIATGTEESLRLSRSGLPIWTVMNTRHQWLKALQSFLSFDDGELKQLAQQHREYVKRYQTIESRLDEWVSAWRATMDVARTAEATI